MKGEESTDAFRQSKSSDRFLLVRKNKKYSSNDRFPKISVRKEIYEELAAVASESLLSMSELASQALRFALDRLDWVEE